MSSKQILPEIFRREHSRLPFREAVEPPLLVPVFGDGMLGDLGDRDSIGLRAVEDRLHDVRREVGQEKDSRDIRWPVTELLRKLGDVVHLAVEQHFRPLPGLLGRPEECGLPQPLGAGRADHHVPLTVDPRGINRHRRGRNQSQPFCHCHLHDLIIYFMTSPKKQERFLISQKAQ